MAQEPISEQSGVQGVPSSTGAPNWTDVLNAYIQSQKNLTGMTSMQPSLQHQSVQQPRPYQQQPLQTARDFSSSGGRKRADMQNLATTIQNVAGKISEHYQQKKAKQDQQVFDLFTQAVQGSQQAVTDRDSAVQELNQAVQSGDQQAIQAAKQKLTSAIQAHAQNQLVLKNLFDGPQGKKHAQMLSKGFGIDDKNAPTPERAAAIQAITKRTGVSGQAANILSQLPQTQQFTPQAQQQIAAQKAGLINPKTSAEIAQTAMKEAGKGSRLQTVEEGKGERQQTGITAKKESQQESEQFKAGQQTQRIEAKEKSQAESEAAKAKLQAQMIQERQFEAKLKAQTARETALLRVQAAKEMKMMPTTASRTMGEMASAMLVHIPDIKKEIDDLEAKGKLGVIAGRYEDFLTGKVGADDPDFQSLRTDLSLFSSGTLRTHFGARGGQRMYDIIKQNFNQAGSSANNIKSSLDAAGKWFETYEEMGAGQVPGEPFGGGGKQQPQKVITVSPADMK
jgi:hypothetical protein